MGVLHEVLSLPVAADKVPHCQSLLRHIQWMAQKVHVHNTLKSKQFNLGIIKRYISCIQYNSQFTCIQPLYKLYR